MGSEGCVGKLLEINNADEDRWLASVFVCALKSLNQSVQKERNKRRGNKKKQIRRNREGFGGGMAWIWGGAWEGGTTMGRQFQFQFQDFFLLSKFSSLHLFLHSLLHIFILLSLILTNSPSPFASISSFLLSFSQFVPSHSTFSFPPSS